MQFGINLLPTKKTGLEVKIGRHLKTYAVPVLSVYTLFLAVLFVSSFYISTKESNLNSEISQTESKIKSYQKRETMALTLKDRMSLIGGILGDNQKNTNNDLSQDQVLTWLQSLLNSGVSLTSINLSNTDMEVAGEADNVSNLASFLDSLPGERNFSSLSLSSLTRLTSGRYSFYLKGGLEPKKNE
ncbi:MAG: PilN domain-containing protein [bacterium]|nr:PilN domain-containing protein [bacterium]